MKNKVILLLVAVVVLASLALVGCGEVPPAMGFVSPGKTVYYVGETLDLTGGKVYGDQMADVALTTSMLDATSYNMAAAGTYTVKGSYQDFNFTFAITVNALPSESAFVSPAKKVYALGEKLLLDGATVTVDGATTAVTADMLDASTLPNFDKAGDYTVAGSYQGVDFAFDVTVYAPYEFKHDTDYVFKRAEDVSKHVWVRQNYADGTQGEWYNVTNNDFSVFQLSADKLHVELDMCINNYNYNYAVDFPFIEITGISVSEFKNLPVGDTSYVYGIVVAITTISTRNEVILADKATGEVISVSDLAVSGATQAMTLDIDVEIGDEIVIPATLTQAESTYTEDGETWNTSDLGKLYGLYTGGKQLSTAVLSKGNTAPINYSNATEIDSQADLQNFLSATNRAANVYTMVHFKGEMGFVWYAKASQLRMYFANGGVTSYTTQKIDNISPVFCDGSQYYTTGATFREMMLGANYSTTSYSTNPGKFLDIYALFIGGNAYYHKFVILKAEDAKPMEATVTGNSFTAPTVTQYTLGSTLNLTGAKVTTSYDIKADEETAVTVDMLDATTIPDFTTAGTYTIKGSYNGYEFSFDIVVADKIVSSVTIESMPTKSTYTHRQGLEDLDLTGGKLRVTYSNDEYEIVDMEKSMLPATDEGWKIGTVKYALTYFGQQVDLPIIYQNTALTISQLLQNTADETTEYELTGVVVRAVTDYNSAELLIKEKNSNVVVGIKGDEATLGAKNAPKLDTSVIKAGDEIALKVILSQSTSTYGGSKDKVYVKALNNSLKSCDLVKLSTGNSTAINLTDNDVTIIDSQEDFVTFLSSTDRFYKYVKIVNVNFVNSDRKNLNMFYKASVNSSEDARIDSVFPRIALVNTIKGDSDKFTNYASNTTDYGSDAAKEAAYSNPATAKYDFYMLLVGGNSAAHHFTILQDSWILK